MVEFLHGVAQSLYAFARGLGGPGLFLIALADSSFVSIPEGNDILIVVLSAGQPWQAMLYFVSMAVMGSVTGCTILYWVGRRGGGCLEARVPGKRLERIRSAYQRWGVWAVVIPSILPPPTPFKIFVLSAGLFRLPFPRFFLAVSLGRSVRYLKWGVLAVLFGEVVGRFIQENLPLVGAGLLVLLTAGVAIGVLLRVRARAAAGSMVP